MFRVFDNYTQSETSVGTDIDIDAGIKYAVDAGANVINLSLGGESPSHEAVLQYAKDQNVCVLAATGNENSSSPSYPGSNPNVLAVGAIDTGFNRASFSNWGPNFNLFVMAPGVQIASTFKENGYVYLQGTSMATPFVSGLAALILSLAKRNGKSLTADDVYRIIRESATPMGSGKGDIFFGEGLVNAQAALAKTKELFQ
jgi:subtilisin family serine protease